ncbi:hypothetical protein DQ04_02611100 [Trypanosoma grayi]|uniref:hypothetical protein n=1 Tax=Trypanosoma grayi TaxID=71804 RepID=UPI0004F41BEB|nr:hypothetical protein DQ04_02611100 [Trypanosoma grayi]KEG11451.1 hypothetical protein DQ04_02611100 [Trypanosoma grayi]
MSSLCIRCGSKDHATREHDKERFTRDSAAQNSRRPNPERELSCTQGHRTSNAVQQRVCWRSVGTRPGIPEVIDKPLREPWVEPCEPLQLICRESTRCPCLSGEIKRKKQ